MTDAHAPIRSRLERLERALREFLADPRARIVCWQLAEDEPRMFEAFIRSRTEAAEPSYVLLECNAPFTARATHGISLVQALLNSERERADELAADGVYDAPWQAPAAPARSERQRGEPPPDQLHLIAALASLKERHCSPGQQLLISLLPEDVVSAESYARWLSELAFLLSDADIRVSVTCALERSFGPVLARAHPGRIWLERAALDMPAALEELNRASTDYAEPPGRYRQHLLQANRSIAEGELAAARSGCEQAAGIAREQGWSHLEFAAHQMLGAAALAFGDLPAAFASFEEAERATHHDIRFGATWLSPLLLQARLSKGVVAITGSVWQLGAKIFMDQALPVARALSDAKSELECRRLAAHCEEHAKNEGRAREHLIAALAVAERVPALERRQTTLPFVGRALLHLARGVGRRSERAQLNQKMTQLLGEDWEGLLEPQSPSDADAEAALDTWLYSAGPGVVIEGPTGTQVLAGPEARVETLTAAVDPALALGQLMAPNIDAEALAEVVSRTWSERDQAPIDWAGARSAAQSSEEPADGEGDGRE